MGDTVDITVIVTTYNLQKYMLACFEGLERQTFRNFDVLVVDDCSNDETVEIIKLKKETGRLNLHFISTGTNQGAPGKTRNFALDSGYRFGRYVVFLDGDDPIEPVYLERLFELAESTQSDIAVCAYDRFEDETGHVLCTEMTGFQKVLDQPLRCDILPFVNTSVWNKLIRYSIIKDVRFPSYSIGEDAVFFLKLYKSAEKISFTNDILIHYRVRSNSVITKINLDNIMQLMDTFSTIYVHSSSSDYRDVVAETALIHIGFSMPLRAYQSKSIDMKHLLGTIRAYFSRTFGFFCSCRWIGLVPFSKRGVRGLGMYAGLICHKLGMFRAFLWLLAYITRVFHFDIKF